MNRTLIISLTEDPEDDEQIAAKVADLLSQGYISGYGPYWEIEVDESPLDL